MPTKADIKKLSKKIKLKVRKNDKVKIISGKDKGQTGIVAAVDPKTNKALVVQQSEENADQYLPLNAAVKHKKARFQGEKSARFQKPMPIDISNLMVLDPDTNEPTRIGRKREGDKIVRFAKKSGTVFVDTSNMEKEDK